MHMFIASKGNESDKPLTVKKEEPHVRNFQKPNFVYGDSRSVVFYGGEC